MNIKTNFNDPKRPMLIEMPFRIQPYDIDFTRVVRNLTYLRWFDDLRMAFHDSYWPLNVLLEKGQKPTIMRCEIEYKEPMTLADNPIGKLWVSSLDKFRWTFELEIIDSNDKLHCKGMQTGFFMDIEEHKPSRLPVRLLEKYERASGNTILSK